MTRKKKKENIPEDGLRKFLDSISSEAGITSEFTSLIQEGIDLIAQGRRKDAISAFQGAIEINPKIASPWQNIGTIYFNMGNYAEAIRYYSRAIDINNKLPMALRNRAIAFERLKAQGAKVSEQVIQKSVQEAERLIYQGEFERVLDLCDSIIQTKSDSFLAWFWKGKALSALARDEEALHCYTLSNNLQQWMTSYSNLMRSRYYLMNEEAKLTDRKMERKPQHTGFFPSAESWSSQGAYVQTLGKFEEALYCFEESLKLDPTYEVAIRNKTRVINLLKEEGIYEPDKDLKKQTAISNIKPIQLKALKEIEEMANQKFEIVERIDTSFSSLRMSPRLEVKINNNNIIELGILNGCIDKLPESIGELSYLEKLVFTGGLFGNKLINTPESLGKLASLKSLNLKSNDLNDIGAINGLNNLSQLKSLILSSNNITEIKGLSNLKNLTWLDLSYNQITEIKGLDELVNLTNLKLDYNKITTIKGLDYLRNLSDLGLFSNKIKKIEGLENLTNLWFISLKLNEIPEDLMKEITGKRERGHHFVGFCQRNVIETNNLDNQFVIYNNIKYYVWEKTLRLKGLNIESINEIKGIENIKDIEVLDLSYNKISEIRDLESLQTLKNLNLHDNDITEIKNLETLTNLEELQLSTNKIKEIKNLNALVNLKKLYLNNNKISEVKGLENLEKLEYLSLHANWEQVKLRIGTEYFNEIGIEHNGYKIQNPQKVVEYCRLMKEQ